MLDLILVLLAVAAAVGGYRIGFVARSVSWVAMMLGVLVAARLMPGVIEAMGDRAGRSTLFLVSTALLVAGATLGQLSGLLVARKVHPRITSPTGQRLDAVGGAVAGVVGLMFMVWLLLPAMADMRGAPAREVRRSRIVDLLTDLLPEAPDATTTLRRLLGDGYPQVFEGLDRSPDLGPPPEATGLTEAQATSIAQSIVKVEGKACGSIQSGAGFVVAPGLVVTNAHVVAGEPSTELEREDGSRIPAELVAFDPRRDLAVLRAPELDAPPLEIGESALDQRGAVFGRPHGGPLELSPFVVRQRVEADGLDIYGSSGSRRDVLVIASDLSPGDSGAPLMDSDGDVVGVAFAIAPDRPGVAYALSTDELRAVLEEVGSEELDSGPCAA